MSLPAAFSYVLKINGCAVEEWGNVEISADCGGMGLSGVCTAQFKFDMPLSEYNEFNPSARSEIEFSCTTIEMSLPKFYTDTRVKHGGTVTIACLDRMAFTDRTIDLDATDFDSNGQINTYTALEQLRSQCGFTAVQYHGGANCSTLIPKMQKSDIYQRSCRSILDALSTACVGYWCVSGENLMFCAYGGGGRSIMSSTVNHAEIDEGLAHQAKTFVIMTDSSGNTYTAGVQTTDDLKIMTVSSPFASAALAGNLMQRLTDYIYQPWSCEKMQINQALMTGTLIPCKDNVSRFCNQITITPTAYGIFATTACNEVSESEFTFKGELMLNLENSLKNGEKCNNMLITRYQGLIFTTDEVDNDETIPKTYGFGVYKHGVTEYDGAITSKVVPQNITADTDAANVSYSLGDKVYNLALTWTGDNITSITRTEAE